MRFTTRDLLWFTVVVGLSTAWIIDRRHLAHEADSAVALRKFCHEQEEMILDLLRERRELLPDAENSDCYRLRRLLNR
jgi:hypothetical protein